MQVIRLAVIISAKTNLKGMAVKKTLSRKQRFFNKINFTTDDEVYVGIDVHKKNCHIAALPVSSLSRVPKGAPSD